MHERSGAPNNVVTLVLMELDGAFEEANARVRFHGAVGAGGAGAHTPCGVIAGGAITRQVVGSSAGRARMTISQEQACRTKELRAGRPCS